MPFWSYLRLEQKRKRLVSVREDLQQLLCGDGHDFLQAKKYPHSAGFILQVGSVRHSWPVDCFGVTSLLRYSVQRDAVFLPGFELSGVFFSRFV